MNKKSVKFLKIVCYVMLALIPLWLIVYGIYSYGVFTSTGGEDIIHWGSPRIGIKVAVFIAHRVALFAMAVLLTAFVINILKNLKNGTIFNRANVLLLWVMVIVLSIYAFLSDNIEIAYSPTEHFDLVLSDNVFLYPLVALIIALLYKIAYDAAEEQKLTI